MFEAVRRFFSKPSADRVKQEQLEDAQREILTALAAAEDHEYHAKAYRAQAAIYQQRVKRLSK